MVTIILGGYMKKKKYLVLSMVTTGLLFFTGCGDGGSDSGEKQTTLYKLSPQSNATRGYLFYGETNPKGLGSLSNITVFDPAQPTQRVIENNNTSVIRYPVLSTSMEYNASDMSYKNFHISTLSYASGTKAYVINMQDKSQSKAVQNSSATNLSKFSYTKVDYIGTHQYLSALDIDRNQTVLITPDMNATTDPILLGNKKLLSVTYPSYGKAIDGYLVYDNSLKQVQKCSLEMDSCIDLLEAGSRDFEGDIANSVYSAFLINGTVFKLNKNNGTKSEVFLEGKVIATGHGTTSFQGSDFYFIATDGNLYRVDLNNEKVVKITAKKDERLERIRGFTDKWVIYGSDTILLASKKDGSTSEPILLAETTKTKGYKYVTNFGVGNKYLFVRYSIDIKSGDTTYSACIFDDGETECKQNSFWASIVAKSDGKIDFNAQYPYTPYAYVRVDDTDDFGGGVLKAIDPNHPLDDGIAMGKVENYNFQTFLSNYRYFTQMIDSDGGIVLFAKNDINFHVDAFYMNLHKENSLIQLTNTNPGENIHKGRDHCHGRHCMICHNFAGGKIYKDLNGTKSAYGYRVRLDFEDGTTLLADISKGKGENFSMPIKKITGNFKANILDSNNTVIKSSVQYYHEGRAFANCNYCHARYGNTRYDAPGAIAISE